MEILNVFRSNKGAAFEEGRATRKSQPFHENPPDLLKWPSDRWRCARSLASCSVADSGSRRTANVQCNACRKWEWGLLFYKRGEGKKSALLGIKKIYKSESEISVCSGTFSKSKFATARAEDEGKDGDLKVLSGG